MLNLSIFLNHPTLASFCLFSFFSNTNFAELNRWLQRESNSDCLKEGKHADHLTKTMAPNSKYLFTTWKKTISESNKKSQFTDRPTHRTLICMGEVWLKSWPSMWQVDDLTQQVKLSLSIQKLVTSTRQFGDKPTIIVFIYKVSKCFMATQHRRSKRSFFMKTEAI